MFQPLFKIMSVIPDRVLLSTDLFVEVDIYKNMWSFCENEPIFRQVPDIIRHNEMT